jgi:hypothetical protein
MARGPLPDPNARRRNAPTIPSTSLPAGGFDGDIPDPPESYTLLGPGAAWWTWVWRTPQAAAFDAGSLYALARRASLEDDLFLLEQADEFDLSDLLNIGEEREALMRLEFFIRKLKALAGGKMAILKEARELDKRFGLDPKAIAENRWQIVDEQLSLEPPEPKVAKGTKKAVKPDDRRARFTALPGGRAAS